MKKIAILMSVVMLVVLTAGFAMAAEKPAAKVEMMSGDVSKIDAKAGTISVMVSGKDMALKAEAKLLEGIAVGDKVNIEATGGVLKSIKKAAAAPAAAPAATPAPAAKPAPKK
jgi:UDP-3-O-[3-hydroxymyristoyl] glucosamine N-acyltransferase